MIKCEYPHEFITWVCINERLHTQQDEFIAFTKNKPEIRTQPQRNIKSLASSKVSRTGSKY